VISVVLDPLDLSYVKLVFRKSLDELLKDVTFNLPDPVTSMRLIKPRAVWFFLVGSHNMAIAVFGPQSDCLINVAHLQCTCIDQSVDKPDPLNFTPHTGIASIFSSATITADFPSR
jgi:hypothetical protein